MLITNPLFKVHRCLNYLAILQFIITDSFGFELLLAETKLMY